MSSAKRKAGETLMAPNILYGFQPLTRTPSASPAFPIGHLNRHPIFHISKETFDF